MDSKTLQTTIIRARLNNPCAVLAEIGTRYGVTREYVRQVLSKAKKPTQAYHQTYLCLQCGKDMGTRKRLFCNRQCRHDYAHIKISCTYCGRLKEYSAKILVWQIERHNRSTDLFFCSKVCQGKWLAENYGLAVYGDRGNRERWGKQNRKWDYSEVYELRDETGWGATRIGRTLEIPIPTIEYILRKRALTLQGQTKCEPINP